MGHGRLSLTSGCPPSLSPNFINQCMYVYIRLNLLNKANHHDLRHLLRIAPTATASKRLHVCLTLRALLPKEKAASNIPRAANSDVSLGVKARFLNFQMETKESAVNDLHHKRARLTLIISLALLRGENPTTSSEVQACRAAERTPDLKRKGVETQFTASFAGWVLGSKLLRAQIPGWFSPGKCSSSPSLTNPVEHSRLKCL